MTENPQFEEFRRLIGELRKHPLLRKRIVSSKIQLATLTTDEISELFGDETGRYFLLAAAKLNRTTLKEAASTNEALIVKKEHRKAFAIKQRLPVQASFDDIASSAVALRRGDLNRRDRGAIETLFRERLAAENIPILMSPPVRAVPGILIGRRKPDGVYPDPTLNKPPLVYLEIKNVRRVADDIQKRLYEVAEASLEMKLLYGSLELRGLGIQDTSTVQRSSTEIQRKLRKQILASPPIVIVILLCKREEAERYRLGAEAFIDRVFFQEEIEDCLSFLKSAIVKKAD